MERSAKKSVLVLALFFAFFLACLEGRNMPAIKPTEPNYKPQNFIGGFGGIIGGVPVGLVPLGPQFGLGSQPGFGTIPGIGDNPIVPAGRGTKP